MVKVQRSFRQDRAKLYIVPTPIGNLEDITLRALRILKEVDLIACEDTRQTKKLLNHFEIEKRLLSYHEHSQESREQELIEWIRSGNSVALVSDAGMPMISDPGYGLVKKAREADLDVVVLPGANAALCALVGSGISAYSFTFYGFLPKKKKELTETLEELDQGKHTLIFYESPYRVKKTLGTMEDVYSSERKVTLARELTKKFEEYISGSIDEVKRWIDENESQLRGEFCIIVEPSEGYPDEDHSWWKGLTLIQHVEHYMEKEQLKTKSAVKKVASDRGMSSREVYQEFHN
ncbi:16S rRNA (cytidine(1402)-2'-O)-methyltransferase [Alkalibacillus aidingensis]|uniref:16S rRNA (cytidine(1402)-2'-O)-methyltransferase n=1 Tax=Alkalibacillus aidingensis TaxID=2747607 RepID=UPI0016612084|nr:16S rRNA (cytidine(1402)-2'-O)-methyltransferase [Alkalibacillus aidingensis]